MWKKSDCYLKSVKKNQKKTDDYDISEHTMVFFFLQRAAKLLISTIFSTVSGEE